MNSQTNSAMQSADFEWFKTNMGSLYEKYGPSFLVVKNSKVIGSFQTYGEAVRSTMKREPLGTFIVQQCGKNKDAYTNYISSMNFTVAE